GADRSVGVFINTLPVRIRVGEEGVAASVRQTRAQLADLLRHEHASLALAQRCSAVPAPTALFSALLHYRHSPKARPPEPSKTVRNGIQVLGGKERTNYPLTLSMDDLGEGFALHAQVRRPLDPRRICGYMHVALVNLVEALETAPDTAARAIDVLPAGERHQ